MIETAAPDTRHPHMSILRIVSILLLACASPSRSDVPHESPESDGGRPRGSRAEEARRDPSPDHAPRAVRVLFIGNSYTYFNDLPAMFAELADAAGYDVEVDRVVEGAATLADHLASGEGARAIEAERWDWVLLQEQSTLGSNRFHDGQALLHDTRGFEDAAEALIELVRRSGAEPALLLTWARSAETQNQLFLNDAYVRVGERADVVVVPAGPAWMEALGEADSLPLHIDGAHPAPAGTYLVAYAVARMLLADSAQRPDFDHLPAGLEIEPDAARTIRGAVDRTIERVGPRGTSLPRKRQRLFELIRPASSATSPSGFLGEWHASVAFLPEVPPSTLTIAIEPGGRDDEVSVAIEFRHDAGGPAASLFPDESARAVGRLEGGVLLFEHASSGFGTAYRFEIGLRAGELTGHMRLDAGARTFFSATLDLERGAVRRDE